MPELMNMDKNNSRYTTQMSKRCIFQENNFCWMSNVKNMVGG